MAFERVLVVLSRRKRDVGHKKSGRRWRARYERCPVDSAKALAGDRKNQPGEWSSPSSTQGAGVYFCNSSGQERG